MRKVRTLYSALAYHCRMGGLQNVFFAILLGQSVMNTSVLLFQLVFGQPLFAHRGQPAQWNILYFPFMGRSSPGCHNHVVFSAHFGVGSSHIFFDLLLYIRFSSFCALTIICRCVFFFYYSVQRGLLLMLSVGQTCFFWFGYDLRNTSRPSSTLIRLLK